MTRGIRLMAALLLSCSLGLHWAMLQSVAWTVMVVERTQSSGLSVALQTTFDGKHPCPLCQVVAAGKKQEKKAEAVLGGLKLEMPVPVPSAFRLPRLNLCHLPAPAPLPFPGRTESPLLPPPRASFA